MSLRDVFGDGFVPGTDDIDGLVDGIGKERASRSPEEIAEAETKLRQALVESRDRMTKRARTIGTVLVAIGVLLGVAAILVLPHAMTDLSENFPPADDDVFLDRAFPKMFLFAGLAQITCGLGLVAGGVGFRSLKHWGRKTILAMIWAAIACCIGFLIFGEVTLLSSGGGLRDTLPAAFSYLIVTEIWVLLLWLAQRYFASQEIKELCNQESRRRMPRTPRRRRVQ